MSFRCDWCGCVSQLGEKVNKVVVERPKIYRDSNGIVVGTGREIQKEEFVCGKCYNKHIENKGE
ncbi:MAG: hypothetical protein WCY37_03590 [Candidatus Dojkabacteria bacterium]